MDFIITADGSKTLYHPKVGEHYHSKHGAVQESKHVFVKMGLQYHLERRQGVEQNKKSVTILEVGFGTGLNFLLSADYCIQQQMELIYTGIEAYPLPLEIIRDTDYGKSVSPEVWQAFLRAYPEASIEPQLLNPSIELGIAHCRVNDFETLQRFDVLYFDAFAAIHQPEMWAMETLAHVCQYLKVGGIFVTYAITGDLKRTMKALGFQIEKVPGAPGKREMLRAIKL